MKALILILSLVAMPSFAQEKKALGTDNSKAVSQTSSEKISIQAKGMVCAFCAQGIEKKFKALPEVSGIKVSLETKKIDVEVKDGKTVTDEQIKQILTESGYELVKIERAK